MAITIKNAERLLKKINEIGNVNLKPVIKTCTLLVQGQAKELCVVNNGDLRGSIHPEVKEKNDTVYGRVYTTKEYAPYVEFGTGPKGQGTYPYEIKGLSLKYRTTKWCYTKDDGKTFIWTKYREKVLCVLNI